MKIWLSGKTKRSHILSFSVAIIALSILACATPNAAASSVPRNGLVGEWNFENNVLDTSGTGNNGALSGGAVFVPGIVGQALNFDGSTGVVSVPNNPTLNFGSTGSFSISLWMKSTQSGTGNAGFGWLVDHRRNNDGIYQGYTIGDRAGIIDARIRDGSANDVVVSSTTNVNNGCFHHIVFVVDRSTQTESLYIDNTLQAAASIVLVGSLDTNFDIHLGGTASPNTLVNFFAGTMDQVRIYNRVLSTSEIQDLFNEGAGVPTANLVGEWKFENNVLDTSGNNNHGINNGATFVPGKIGTGLSFDGIDDVVVVANSPTLNFGSTGSFSISLWMKTTQASALIVDKRPNNDGQYKGYSIELNSGLMIGRIRDGSANDAPVYSTTSVNDGVFHHIVYVVDRTSQTEKMYVDNNLQATTNISSVGNIDSTVNLLFGGQAPPNTQVDFYSGILDQIRIYNVALSSSDVQNLFNEGSNVCGDDTDPATLGSITAPTNPVPVNTQITASDSFTDDSDDTHTATWNWGDGNTTPGTVTESGGSGSVQDTHTYTAPGIYTITLTVSNSDGASSSTQFKYVVVYDPTGGFVTGGGWIISPPGAYPANPAATGKANFGFNVRYHGGSSSVPTGNTEFSFNAGNIDFSSTGYNWLVVSSSTQAQFQGTGTINGAGNYLFNIAIQSGSTNYIRIQILDNSNNVVYDTQPGAPLTASPTTPLGGGSFVIHPS